jgi:long-chain acyl-CoA synthetase
MEGVMAEVVLEAGAEIDVESLISYCRRKLSAYKVPQKVHVVDALPMTDSGKLIRHDAGIS